MKPTHSGLSHNKQTRKHCLFELNVFRFTSFVEFYPVELYFD